MKIIKQNGKEYMKIGNKAVPFTLDESGKPIITPVVERKVDKDGKEHVTVKIPCLKIKSSNNK